MRNLLIPCEGTDCPAEGNALADPISGEIVSLPPHWADLGVVLCESCADRMRAADAWVDLTNAAIKEGRVEFQ